MKTVSPLKHIAIKSLVFLSLSCLEKTTPHENRLRTMPKNLSLTSFVNRKRKRGSPDCPERDGAQTKRAKLDPNLSREDSAPSSSQTKPGTSLSFEEADIEQCKVIDTVIQLRKYFSCLPDELWSDFFSYAMEKLDLHIRKKILNVKAVTKACEMLFCSKVLKFNSKLSTISWNSSFEEVIYERLRLCRKLRSLQIDTYPCSEKSERLLFSSLASLQKLNTIEMLPSTRQSFHWAIPIISKNCKLLSDLSIVYNSENFNEGESIELLHHCSSLKNLSLFSFGNKSEGKSLMGLLANLKRLRRVFHKELPNALVQSCFDGNQNENRKFNLESIVLVEYTRSIGSQLIYIPNSFMIEIATMCRNLNHLTLIQPSNLLNVAEAIPCLQSLTLHQSLFSESLTTPLNEKKLTNLKILKLRNMELVTYEDMEAVSFGCPRLEELEVSDSNLVGIGHSFDPTDRVAWPHLRSLTAIQHSHGPINFFRSQKWELGRSLINFLLRGTKDIEFLSLEFSSYGHLSQDLLRAEDFLLVLTGINTLQRTFLKYPPFKMTYKIVEAIATSNVHLVALGTANTWVTPEEDENEIRSKFSSIITYGS